MLSSNNWKQYGFCSYAVYGLLVPLIVLQLHIPLYAMVNYNKPWHPYQVSFTQQGTNITILGILNFWMNLDRNKPLRQGIVGWITARTSTYYLPKASCQCYECVLLQCIITNALPLQRNLVTWCQMLERTCQTLPASGVFQKEINYLSLVYVLFDCYCQTWPCNRTDANFTGDAYARQASQQRYYWCWDGRLVAQWQDSVREVDLI